jgi:hypothetical protein
MNLRKIIREALENDIVGFGRDYSEETTEETPAEKPVEKSSQKSTPTINFANKNQVILYEEELKGQISDGHWENSRPNDHWMPMTNAKAQVGSPLGPNFFPRRRYNFASGELVSVVGDRMVFYVKLFNTYPSFHKHKEIYWDGEAFWRESGSDSAYHRSKLNKIVNALGILKDEYEETIAALEKEYQKILSYPYSKGDLMRDLKEMSRIVNSKYRS